MRRAATHLGLIVLVLAAACGSTSSGPDGSSGGHGTGGSSGGGSSGGGSLGNGGRAGSGGTAATGGSAAGTGGGSAGTGGNAGAGGHAGGGGRAGAAGNGGAAGGASGSGGRAGTSGTAGAAGGGNDVDVFLIGGQSNATGQGYAKNIPSSFVVDTKVQLYHSSAIVSGGAANTWIALRPASEGTDGCNLGMRFGPELGFGNTIHAHYPSRPIYIIKHARSNTGLVTDWAPGTSPTDTAHFGPEFQTFVSTVDGGLAALKSMGRNPVIRAMLWQQGERDVDLGGTAAAEYGKNLAAFVARVRDQWKSPNMLFVYGYVYPASAFGTARDEVRKAEADLDQDSGSALATKGAFVVSTDGLSLRANDPGTCYPDDKTHFGTQGQLDLGRLMGDKVHDHLGLP